MKLSLTLCLLCLCAMPASGQLVPRGYSTDHLLRGVGEVDSGNAKATARLQVREVWLNARMPNGHSEGGSLLVLFDPERKLFQWRLVTGQLAPGQVRRPTPGESALPPEFEVGARMAYVTRDAFVTFTIMPSCLYVFESRDRADNLNEATTASLKAAEASLPEYATHGPSYGKAVDLSPQLMLSFFQGPEGAGSASVPVIGGARIVDVSRQNGEWKIVVQGQWKEKIVLNDKFELISMTRVD
jgi:hypothetical protein